MGPLRKRGFTVIELLVSLVIVAVLLAILVTGMRTNIMTLDGSCYLWKPPAKFSLRAAELIMRSTATGNPRDGKTDTTPFGWLNSW